VETILALAISLSCPVPEIVNLTKVWTKDDAGYVQMAQKRCPKLFPGTCLKSFTKKPGNHYDVVCQEPRGA